MQPVRTARLLLEPQVAAHAEEMFDVLSDPAIYEYENEPPVSVEWLRARFARLEARASPDGSEAWLNWVVRGEGGRLIGYVQATVAEDGSALIGYILASEHWGRGFGGEATKAMMDALMRDYGVTGFRAVLKRANLRSRRLLEGLGFSPVPNKTTTGAVIDDDELMMTFGP